MMGRLVVKTEGAAANRGLFPEGLCAVRGGGVRDSDSILEGWDSKEAVVTLSGGRLLSVASSSLVPHCLSLVSGGINDMVVVERTGDFQENRDQV